MREHGWVSQLWELFPHLIVKSFLRVAELTYFALDASVLKSVHTALNNHIEEGSIVHQFFLWEHLGLSLVPIIAHLSGIGHPRRDNVGHNCRLHDVLDASHHPVVSGELTPRGCRLELVCLWDGCSHWLAVLVSRQYHNWVGVGANLRLVAREFIGTRRIHRCFVLLFVQTSRFAIVHIWESFLRILFFLLLFGGNIVHETSYLLFIRDLIGALVALLELRLNKCFANCGVSLVIVVRRSFVAGKCDYFVCLW